MGNDVLTFTTSRRIRAITRQRIGDKAAELPQQGFHLALHSFNSSDEVLVVYGLQQLVKIGVRVAKVDAAEEEARWWCSPSSYLLQHVLCLVEASELMCL